MVTIVPLSCTSMPRSLAVLATMAPVSAQKEGLMGMWQTVPNEGPVDSWVWKVWGRLVVLKDLANALSQSSSRFKRALMELQEVGLLRVIGEKN